MYVSLLAEFVFVKMLLIENVHQSTNSTNLVNEQ